MTLVPTVAVAEATADTDAVRLDVREDGEFFLGHAPDALHIPLGQLEQRLGEVPESGRVICICRSGNRSAHATAFLVAHGRDAVNMAGGMIAWSAEGHMVIDADGRIGTVA